MVLEDNPEFVCVKLDFRNAFNEMRRSSVIEVLEKEDPLRQLGSSWPPAAGWRAGSRYGAAARKAWRRATLGSGLWFAVGL